MFYLPLNRDLSSLRVYENCIQRKRLPRRDGKYHERQITHLLVLCNCRRNQLFVIYIFDIIEKNSKLMYVFFNQNLTKF